MSEERIRVVSAAIIHKGRILLAQRAPTSSFPWHWCTPGGKVEGWAEEGETDLQALERELREELGLERPLPDAFFANTTLAAMRCFDIKLDPPAVRQACRAVCYRIHSVELPLATPSDGIVGVGWFGPEGLASLSLTPADRINSWRLAEACVA